MNSAHDSWERLVFFLECGCLQDFEGQLKSSQLLLVKVELVLLGGSNFYFVYRV